MVYDVEGVDEMKKKWIAGLSLLMMMTSAVPVYAMPDAVMAETDRRVMDDADILSDDTEEELESTIEDLMEEYEMDVVILTVDDYQDYAAYQDSYFYDIAEFADFFYNVKGYGLDSENSGMLLVLSMAGGEGNRDVRIEIEGAANEAVNDYGSEYIMDRLIDKLRDGDYDEACVRYLEDLELFFEEYESGEPFGDDHRVRTPMMYLTYFGVAVGISAVLALIIISIMKSQMNTAKPQTGAREYVRKDSFRLTNQQDLYLYSNMTKTARPKDSGSSGGGGRSSGSRGGGGRSGKF